MRVKTSISLSSDILDQVSRFATGGERSNFIEKALWNYLDFLKRRERNQLDLKKINDSAVFLNDEANDVLDYQASL